MSTSTDDNDLGAWQAAWRAELKSPISAGVVRGSDLTSLPVSVLSTPSWITALPPASCRKGSRTPETMVIVIDSDGEPEYVSQSPLYPERGKKRPPSDDYSGVHSPGVRRRSMPDACLESDYHTNPLPMNPGIVPKNPGIGQTTGSESKVVRHATPAVKRKIKHAEEVG